MGTIPSSKWSGGFKRECGWIKLGSIIRDPAGGRGRGKWGDSLSMVLKDRHQKIGNFWIDLSIKAGEEAKSVVPEATPSPPTASLSGRYEKDGWIYTRHTHTYPHAHIHMHKDTDTPSTRRHTDKHSYMQRETHTIHMHAIL